MNEAKEWNDKAITLDEQGRVHEALEAWNEAIRLDPSYAEAWYNKGAALSEQDKLDDAFEAWDEAIRLDPNFIDYWNIKGYRFYIQGRYDEAIRAYSKAIGINIYLRFVWNDKADALGKQGKHDEVNEAFDKIIKIGQQLAEVFYHKGLAFAAQGKIDEACKFYYLALRNNAEHPDASNMLEIFESGQKNEEHIDELDEQEYLKKLIEDHEERISLEDADLQCQIEITDEDRLGPDPLDLDVDGIIRAEKSALSCMEMDEYQEMTEGMTYTDKMSFLHTCLAIQNRRRRIKRPH